MGWKSTEVLSEGLLKHLREPDVEGGAFETLDCRIVDVVSLADTPHLFVDTLQQVFDG